MISGLTAVKKNFHIRCHFPCPALAALHAPPIIWYFVVLFGRPFSFACAIHMYTPFATPLATSFTTFIPILGSSVWCLGLLAFSLLPLVFVTLSFLYVTFVLVVTMFATVTTGDGTPEMVLMGHGFSIFSVLLSFHLQYTTTAVVAVRGMARSPLVIDRFTEEQRGCTCFRLNLINGTQVTSSFTTTMVGVSGIFRSFPFATFGGRGTTSTQVFLEKFLHVGVIVHLKG